MATLGPAPAFVNKANDEVEHPEHYTSHPSGIECIQVTEHMSFNLGNVVKYIWRADLKGYADKDLKKALWYLRREITKRENLARRPLTIPEYLNANTERK